MGESSECILAHNTAGATSACGAGNTFTATSGTGFGTTATSYTSTLSGTATSILDDTLVECFGPALSRDAGNRVGGDALQTSGECYIALHIYFCILYKVFFLGLSHVALTALKR